MERGAAIVARVGLGVIVAFQVALALGAPLGRAAWGGRHAVLPTRLRVGGAVAAAVWTLAALVVLDAGGLETIGASERVARWGAWIVAGLLVVGALTNAASSSRWERFGWAPVALVLGGLCVVVAPGA